MAGMLKKARPLLVLLALALLMTGPVLARELPRRRVELGGRVLLVEVARSPAQRHQGLSGRAALVAGQGMLFIFPTVRPVSMTMRDMRFPLDFIWLKGGRVVGIVPRMAPGAPGSGSIDSPGKVDMVLEVPAGWAAKGPLRLGERLRFLGQGGAPR